MRMLLSSEPMAPPMAPNSPFARFALPIALVSGFSTFICVKLVRASSYWPRR